MAELNRLNAEGKVVKIGDKEYTLSPLRIKELSKLEKWAEDVILAQAQQKINLLKETGLDIKSEAIVSIVDKAVIESKNQRIREKEMETIDGIKYAIKLSLQVKHGHIEEAEIEKIIEEMGIENIESIVSSLSYATEKENEEIKKN